MLQLGSSNVQGSWAAWVLQVSFAKAVKLGKVLVPFIIGIVDLRSQPDNDLIHETFDPWTICVCDDEHQQRDHKFNDLPLEWAQIRLVESDSNVVLVCFSETGTLEGRCSDNIGFIGALVRPTELAWSSRSDTLAVPWVNVAIVCFTGEAGALEGCRSKITDSIRAPLV